jgi:uncharacterized membrane protein SpoIIM required for sporulation
LISTRWIEKRKPYWDQLEQLLARCTSGKLQSLTRSELQDLSLLYRQIAADLATITQDPSSVHFARYLNHLLARAHNTIYAGHKTSPKALLDFFYREYPDTFRRNLNYCVAAIAVFIIGAAVGSLLTLQDPDFQLKILGPGMVDTIQRREMWTHSVLSMKPLASSAIMTNNMSVSFMTFAMGITAGLGTIYMLLFNGLLIGVIGTACWLAGMSLKLWSFVAPHGVLELPAIFIAGGAGLRIATGLLFPGLLPRRQSLVLAGKEAATMIIGTVPLLAIAGVIEGFVSPTGISPTLKFLLAIAIFVLLLAYLFGLSNPVAQSKLRSLTSR